MERKKTFTLALIGLFIFLFGVIGITYAYWQLTLTQTDENLVYTDCLKITTSLTDTGSFILNNAYPMTNEELVSDFFPNQEPYHFTIENQCDNEIPISINMESLNTESPNLSDEYVDVILWEDNDTNVFEPETDTVLSYKGSREEIGSYELKPSYKLTDNRINADKIIEEANGAYRLYNFKLGGKESKSFNLLLFMDYDTPVDGTLDENDEPIYTNNANWAGKITLNNYETIPNVIRKIEQSDSNGIWEYKSQITKIVFQDTINPPANYVSEFDESAAQDGSVMSYIVLDEESACYQDCYIAYIQGDKQIYANPDSSYLFAGFENTKAIEGIDILNTENVTNMSHMFYDMESLETLDLSTFATTQVTDMSYMFYEMYNVTSLILGNNFNTSNVTNMSYMFAIGHDYRFIGAISELRELDLSSFDTSKVTDMSGMFSKAVSLETLTLGDNFNTSQVTDMGGMFSECGVSSLNLGKSFDTSNVINMSSMFKGSGLESVDFINNFNISQVENMSSMFSNMYNLQTLDLREITFDTSHVINMSQMFAYSDFTELYLGDTFNTSNVTDMSDMFNAMSSLKTLDLGNNFNPIKITDMSDMFENLDVETLNLGDNFVTSQVTDMSYMFFDCENLTSLNLGKSFDTSQVTDMSKMFMQVRALPLLDLGEKFNTSNVTNMSSMFGNMNALQTLDLGELFDTKNVTNMDYMFGNDGELQTITYGDKFVHNLEANIDSMFSSCPANKPTDESWKDTGYYDGTLE